MFHDMLRSFDVSLHEYVDDYHLDIRICTGTDVNFVMIFSMMYDSAYSQQSSALFNLHCAWDPGHSLYIREDHRGLYSAAMRGRAGALPSQWKVRCWYALCAAQTADVLLPMSF